jgi:hypothetical protein
MFRRFWSVEEYERAVADIWRLPREHFNGSLDMRELVRCATLAASSHNTQPWKFKMDDDIISILPDWDRRCPAVDPDNSHLFKSLGCAAENLVQAAAAQGYVGHVRFEPSTDSVVIHLDRSRHARMSELFRAIFVRQCVRMPYNGTTLESSRLAELVAVSHGADVSPLLLTSDDQMETIIEYVREGNLAQFGDPAFARELRDWIRFNPREAMRTGDGLAGLVTGEPSVPAWFGRLIFSMVASGKKQSDTDAANIRSSAGIIAFVGERDDKANWVEAGRAYERFALKAVACGVRNAFINQPIEVRRLGPQLLSWLGLQDKHVHLLVRFGEGPTVPHSLRRPLDQVLL